VRPEWIRTRSISNQAVNTIRVFGAPSRLIQCNCVLRLGAIPASLEKHILRTRLAAKVFARMFEDSVGDVLGLLDEVVFIVHAGMPDWPEPRC